MYSWVFMRGSGIVLVVLVFGHLFMNLCSAAASTRSTGASSAGEWASPFWQIWDLTMLWLAELHGANGLRTDHQRLLPQPGTRFCARRSCWLRPSRSSSRSALS